MFNQGTQVLVRIRHPLAKKNRRPAIAERLFPNELLLSTAR
jgi:hypothetical protein